MDLTRFLDVSLASWENADGSGGLSPDQRAALHNYFHSAGSGPGNSSLADWLEQRLQDDPARYSRGDVSYTFYSRFENQALARQYVSASEGRAGLIDYTPWGVYMDNQGQTDLDEIGRRLEQFVSDQGWNVTTYNNDSNFRATANDIMWGAASRDYARAAVESGRPVVAFVEGAETNRIFLSIELPEMARGNAFINGIRVDEGTSLDQLVNSMRDATDFADRVGQGLDPIHYMGRNQLFYGWNPETKTHFGRDAAFWRTLPEVESQRISLGIADRSVIRPDESIADAGSRYLDEKLRPAISFAEEANRRFGRIAGGLLGSVAGAGGLAGDLFDATDLLITYQRQGAWAAAVEGAVLGGEVLAGGLLLRAGIGMLAAAGVPPVAIAAITIGVIVYGVEQGFESLLDNVFGDEEFASAVEPIGKYTNIALFGDPEVKQVEITEAGRRIFGAAQLLLEGSAGNDLIQALMTEMVKAGDGDDLILAAVDPNGAGVWDMTTRVEAGAGQDRVFLSGQASADLGSGDDIVVAAASPRFVAPQVDVEGGAGVDTLIFELAGEYADSGIFLNLFNVTPGTIGSTETGFTASMRAIGNLAEQSVSTTNVEGVVLTDRGDIFRVTAEAIDAPVLVDMGDFQRGQIVVDAEGNPVPGERPRIYSSDFDELDFSSLGKPIVALNGVIGEDSTYGQPDFGGIAAIRYILEAGYTRPSPRFLERLGVKLDGDSLMVGGAEKITLTAGNDTYIFKDPAQLAAHYGGWRADLGAPDFGIVRGGGGNDILVAHDPDAVPLGGAIGLASTEGPDLRPIAGEELRLTLDGGQGDDWVLSTGGGLGSVVVGGEGSDLLFNNSWKGQLYGDRIDGTGGDDDTFWWSAGSFIMDAEKHDRLQMFGIPLVGGTNLWRGLEKGVVGDWLIPWITYGSTTSGQLLVSWGNLDASESGEELLAHSMVVENYDFGGNAQDGDGLSAMRVGQLGDLGMVFRVYGGEDEISLFGALFGHIATFAKAMMSFAKNINWRPADDPLVLDLNGDGIQTHGEGAVHFDMDGNYFAESLGWIGPHDGFLVFDADASGTIDDVSEMFGSPGVSGFAELGAWDANADGLVDAADAGFSTLQVWRDIDGDAATDGGELRTLQELGIASISLSASATDQRVKPGQNILLATSSFTMVDGTVRSLGDAALAYKPAGAGSAAGGALADAAGPFAPSRKGWEPGITGPEEALPDLTEALRAGLGDARFSIGTSGLSMNLPAGVGPFDHFASTPAQQDTASAGGDETMAGRQDIPEMLVPAADGDEAAFVPTERFATAADLRIALMVQNMAVFGAAGGESEFRSRDRETPRLDYFA